MVSCIKCNNSTFQLEEVTPRGSNFVLNFIKCSSCDGAVGVIDFYNIGELIHQLSEKLGVSLNR